MTALRTVAFVIVLAGLACSRSNPRRFEVDLLWKNKFTWDDVNSRERHVVLLTPEEIETIKGEALETLRAAFEKMPNVGLWSGGRITDRIEVHNLDGMFLGETSF
jgi:hypothetical protein